METEASSTSPVVQKTVAGWVLGILSFIPLIGVVFGIIAIVIGSIKHRKGPIILGSAGILFTALIYGAIFYFGFVANKGVYADLKSRLTIQVMGNDAGQILIYKNKYGNLPERLSDVSKSENMIFGVDPWNIEMLYTKKSEEVFELRSAGPDKVMQTEDDIVQEF